MKRSSSDSSLFKSRGLELGANKSPKGKLSQEIEGEKVPTELLQIVEKARKELIFEEVKGERLVTGGSLSNFLNFVLLSPPTDEINQFQVVLLLTFRRFSSKESLLQRVSQMFYLYHKKSQVVTSNVASFLYKWFDEHRLDFEKDRPFITSFSEFCIRIGNKSLMTLLKNKKKKNSSLIRSLSNSAIPKCLVKNSLTDQSFLSFSPSDIAKEWCMDCYKKVVSVAPVELLEVSIEGSNYVSRNIKLVAEHFNEISLLVNGTILNEKRHSHRVKLVKFFIEVSKCALDLHNFHLLMAVLSGLNSASLQRLKKLWNDLQAKHVLILGRMMDLMSINSNFANYRKQFEASTHPKLPYFGILQKDLLQLTSASKKFLETEEGKEEEPKVNFFVYQQCSILVEPLRECKKQPYLFHSSIQVQRFLSCLPSYNEEDLFQRSYKIEPSRSAKKNFF